MDSDDKLIVVDATNNSASWYNLPKAVDDHIHDQWNKWVNGGGSPPNYLIS